MFKKLLFLVAVLCYLPSANACDSCGCSTAGGGLGGLFYADQNLVGLRWIHSGFTATHFENGLPIEEQYQQAELWMRYSLSPRIQLSAFVPYNFFNRKIGEQNTQLKGIGDARFLASYTIWQTTKGKDMTRLKRHVLQLGGGIKLGTGKFVDAATDPNIPNTFQLGTGSASWLLNAVYNYKKRKVGFSFNTLLQIPTTNSDDYRYGIQWNSSIAVSVEQQVQKVQLIPFIGVNLEYMDYDQRKGFEQHGTNGKGVFGLAGAEANLNQFSASLYYYHPIYQSYADDEIDAKGRSTLSIAYLF